MSDYLQRMIEEKAALDEKLAKLVAFKYSSAFDRLEPGELERLNTQGHHMCAYSAILGARIEYAKQQAGITPPSAGANTGE